MRKPFFSTFVKIAVLVVPLHCSVTTAKISTECECLRHENAKVGGGWKMKSVTSGNSRSSFRQDFSCGSSKPSCFQKNACNVFSGSQCFDYDYCEAGDPDCVSEVGCDTGCVRREKVEIGFRFVLTTAAGFVYKDCGLGNGCERRVQCHGSTDKGCGLLEKCVSTATESCFDEVPCCEGIDPPVSDECDCVRHRKVKVGIRLIEVDANTVDSFAMVHDCEHDANCFRKQRCGPNDKCVIYRKCENRDDCVEEVDCYGKCVMREAVAKGFRFEQHSEPVGFFYDKCAHNEKCARKIPCHENMLDSKECGDLRECDTAVGHENCYVEKDCPGPCDEEPESPCECYRHEKVNVGYRLVSADESNTVDHKPFLKKECPEDASCFIKVDCDPKESDPDCLSYEPCQSDDRSCVAEVNCFGDCVRREWGTTGFWFDITNSQSGFRYEKCGFDDECEEKVPCQLAGTDPSGCGELRPCLDGKDDTGNKMKCFEELKCPYPCNPSFAPSSKPSKDNEPNKSEEPSLVSTSKPSKDDNSDKSEEPSPASSPKPSKVDSSTPDCDCFRLDPLPIGQVGVSMVSAEPNSLVKFRREKCMQNDDCFRKKACDKAEPTSNCMTYRECDGGPNCYEEVVCLGTCIRKEYVDVGLKFVKKGSGFFYDKCPHNEDGCLLKRKCDASSNKQCGELTDCSPNNPSDDGEECFKELLCPTPCDPTAAPSSVPSKDNEPDKSEQPSPALSPKPSPAGGGGPSDCHCLRHESADKGWRMRPATPNSLVRFTQEKCPGYDDDECFVKGECTDDNTIGLPCMTYDECVNGNCVVEVECFGRCVRKEPAEEGLMFAPTDVGSRFYYDECPHNEEDCFLKILCDDASTDKKCGALKKCGPDTPLPFGEKCFKETECPRPCDPTPTPSLSPSKTSSSDCHCYRHELAETGWTVEPAKPNSPIKFRKEQCPDNDECFLKKECDSTLDECLTYRKCNNGDCVQEVECSGCVRKEHVEYGSMFTPIDDGFGFFYDACPNGDTDCLLKVSCTASKDKRCGVLRDCTPRTVTPTGEKERCFRELRCSGDCDPTPSPTVAPAPSQGCECFRREKAKYGFKEVKAGPSTKDNFIKKECPTYPDKCYKKEKCDPATDPIEKCLTYRKCEGDDCFREVNCNRCVRHVFNEKGFKLVPATSMRGFIYKDCPHAKDCLEKIPCSGFSGQECMMWEKCSVLDNSDETCLKEERCPLPCDPTPSPSLPLAPTPAPIFQNEPDECECYRHDKPPNGVGFRIVGADPNTPGSFVMSECPDGEECFRKEVCASFNDDCVVYEKCEGDDCVDEVNCFGKCVIRETTKEGFMFEPTPGRGFYYASCEHNADCLQKMPCNDEMFDKCGTLVKCDPTTSFTMCFTEYRCPSPCPPSSSPTSAPTPLCRLGGKLTRMFNGLL